MPQHCFHRDLCVITANTANFIEWNIGIRDDRDACDASFNEKGKVVPSVILHLKNREGVETDLHRGFIARSEMQRDLAVHKFFDL